MASRELMAVPSQRRQLEVGKPLILWRAAPGGGREGLVCHVRACARPECRCQDVWLAGVLADERLVSAGMNARGNLCLTHAADAADREAGPRTEPGGGWPLRTTIDVRSGLVRPSPPTAQPERQEDLLAWLGAELDGELLDHLYGELQAAKGATDWRLTPDPSAIARSLHDGGLPVAYQDLFPSDREDYVLPDGRIFSVADSYCINPKCTCEDATTYFVEVEGVDKAAVEGSGAHGEAGDGYLGEVGVVVVSPPYQEPGEIELYDGSVTEASLRRLWSMFAERHRGRDLLSRRRTAVRAIAAAMLALWDGRPPDPDPDEEPDDEPKEAPQPAPVRRTATKVGRNDPCPCGSGKKYKKCCMGKAPRDVSAQGPAKRPAGAT